MRALCKNRNELSQKSMEDPIGWLAGTGRAEAEAKSGLAGQPVSPCERRRTMHVSCVGMWECGNVARTPGIARLRCGRQGKPAAVVLLLCCCCSGLVGWTYYSGLYSGQWVHAQWYTHYINASNAGLARAAQNHKSVPLTATRAAACRSSSLLRLYLLPQFHLRRHRHLVYITYAPLPSPPAHTLSSSLLIKRIPWFSTFWMLFGLCSRRG